MDFLERKNISLLQRLRQLQVEQCCLHIDQQIGLWYQNQVDPLVPPTSSQGDHNHHHPHHHYNHHYNHQHHHNQPPQQQQQNQQQQHHHHHQQQQQQPPQPLEQEKNCSQEPISKEIQTSDTNSLTADSTHQTVATKTEVDADEKTTNTITTTTTTNTTPTTIETPSVVVKTEATDTGTPTITTIPSATTTLNDEVETTIPSIVKAETNEITEDTTVYFDSASPQLPSPCMTIGASAIIEADTSTPSPVTLPHLQDGEERTIGCFLSNIKHLESFDSDATESTSSNDSYDELEGFSHEDIPPKRSNYHYYYHHPGTSHSHQASTSSSTSNAAASASAQYSQSLYHRRMSSQHNASAATTSAISGNHDFSDIKKKAIWKWAHERCRLASRWTWLQAQVADLEFRIRGQNDATMHARSYKTPPLPPVLPEHSCSRTVPLSKDFRRRRLIKSSQILSDSNKKLVKFSHVPCICSSLPQTVAPCLSCNGRYNYLRQIEGENAPVRERISLLDPCCHPVLSFPDDLTLGSQISYLLKQETINRKPVKGRPGRKKGSTAANLAAAAAAAAANGDKNAKHPGKKGKYYHGMVGRPPGSQKNPSQTMITSNKLRRKYRKHSNTNNYDSNNWNGANNHNHANSRRNKRIRRASSMNESSVCSESSNQYRPNHFSTNTAQNVTRRRRSEQSAYDIDNIVIPFSIAATTRVEILEYKEIMTPSWRVWENGTCQTEAVEEDIEDTSDEAYITRHSKGECEEKKRFSLKPPKTRVDSIQCIPSLN